jgi:predicted AAA+ superfamily ATPase
MPEMEFYLTDDERMELFDYVTSNEGVFVPDLFYSNYYSTYVERDVRQLVQLNNQKSFELFVKLLAGRVGQIVSLNSMAGDIGVSSVTLASWLSVLEASYIIFKLRRYNSGKEAGLYYFRDQKGFEIDLILNEGRNIIPIEIKAARTYNVSLADNIRKFLSLSRSVKGSAVIYAGKEKGKINNVNFVNFRHLGDFLNAH